jgi:Protein of unknown function (DUF3667)
LWRTLGVLVARPGVLTREFFAGRRARYLPPVRFYLVISVVFFLLAGLASESARNVVVVDAKDSAGQPARENVCTEISYTGPFQDWLRQRLARQCDKIVADGGRGLARAIVHNLPRALFVLLPLLAALMLLMYWWPRRYYVEHLLFLLHNHTLLFIGYTFLLLLGFVFPTGGFVSTVGFLFHLYLLWYYFRGMRVFYGQGRGITAAKYLVLAVEYLIFGGLTLVATMLASALTL